MNISLMIANEEELVFYLAAYNCIIPFSASGGS
jgi:hypothetical protein